MTEKDFEAIGKILKHTLGTSHLLHPLVQTISRYFEDEYSIFNKEKFKNAIYNGKEEEYILPEPTIEKEITLPKMAVSERKTYSNTLDRVLNDLKGTRKHLTEIIEGHMNE